MNVRPAYPPLSTAAEVVALPTASFGHTGRAEQVPGYLVSSFELRNGLDVSALTVASLPAEILREFQRLRQVWER